MWEGVEDSESACPSSALLSADVDFQEYFISRSENMTSFLPFICLTGFIPLTQACLSVWPTLQYPDNAD